MWCKNDGCMYYDKYSDSCVRIGEVGENKNIVGICWMDRSENVKLKDIYDLFDIVLHIYVDDEFIADSMEIDEDKDSYKDLFDKVVKAIIVGDGEVAIEC